MKIYNNAAIYLLLFIALLCGCHKTTQTLVAPSTVNVVNLITNSGPIIPVFGTMDSIQYFSTAESIGYGGYFLYSLSSGTTSLYVVQNTDTVIGSHGNVELFNGSLALAPGGIYTLFLVGSDTTKVDTLLIKDAVPFLPSSGDSVTDVRFVDLATDVGSVKITIQGDSAQTPVTDALIYKGVSPFKPMAANESAQSTGYVFEFRDSVTDSVLATFPLNLLLYKSQTVVLYGTVLSGYAALTVNDY